MVIRTGEAEDATSRVSLPAGKAVGRKVIETFIILRITSNFSNLSESGCSSTKVRWNNNGDYA